MASHVLTEGRPARVHVTYACLSPPPFEQFWYYLILSILFIFSFENL
jgi:hypothetical protein